MNSVKCVFFAYILSFVSFFSPQFLSFKIEEQVSKAILYVLYVLFFILTINNNIKEKNVYTPCFLLILWGILISMFMASTQHSAQSFFVSIIATLPYIVPFSTFLLLKRTKLTINDLEKMFIVIGVLNVILTLQLWGLMPNQLFGGLREEDDGRGIRIAISGDIFKMFLFFYSIYQFKNTMKIKYACLIILCLLTVFLSLTRQVIVISLLLGLMYFLKKLKLYMKIIIVAISVSSILYLTQLSYFENLILVSQRQLVNDTENENIRITAYKYFLNDSQKNILTRILGNGCYSYGNSQYGIDEKRNQYNTLCFPSDVSIASFYWFFGVLGIFGIMLILFKTVKLEIPDRYKYLKYVIYYIMLASIASGPLLYYSQNIVLVVTCYMLGKINYLTNNENRNISSEL